MVAEPQHSIIIGSLLGDGSMRCKVNALLEINHCLAQRDYVDWKYACLQSLTGTSPKARHGKGNRIAYRFTTFSLPELTEYYRMFYRDGRKFIPPLTVSRLALSVWFMDDGSKTYRSVYLNTQQFDIPDQRRLLSILRRQFAINATLNKDKAYWRIRVAGDSMGLFQAAVRPYIRPEFLYKLPNGQ